MKVSVIIPVYNVQKYLRRCINSVINQTYKNIEIILVNDGSTDESGKICDEYAKDNRVIVIHKKNGGLSSARNVGLDKLSGDYIIFLDSDDWLDIDLIETLVNKVSVKCVDLIIFNYKKHLNGGVIQESKVTAQMVIDEYKKKMWSDNFFSYIWRGFFKKNIWKTIRFPEEHCYEDILTWPKILSQEKINIEFLEKPYYNYEGRNTNSIMSKGTIYHYYFNFRGNLEKMKYTDKIFEDPIVAGEQFVVAYRLMVFNALKSMMIHCAIREYLSEDQIDYIKENLNRYKSYASCLKLKYRTLLWLFFNSFGLFCLYSKKYNLKKKRLPFS